MEHERHMMCKAAWLHIDEYYVYVYLERKEADAIEQFSLGVFRKTEIFD